MNLIPSETIGYPEKPSYLGDAWLIKTDASGNVVWNQTYGGVGVDEAYSLVACSDGGYALAGSTGHSGGYGLPDFWLIKTDEFGVVPEFPAWIMLPSLMILALTASMLFRRRERT